MGEPYYSVRVDLTPLVHWVDIRTIFCVMGCERWGIVLCRRRCYADVIFELVSSFAVSTIDGEWTSDLETGSFPATK